MTQEELDALMAGDLDDVVAADESDAQASGDENLYAETADKSISEYKEDPICRGLRPLQPMIIRWFIS